MNVYEHIIYRVLQTLPVSADFPQTNHLLTLENSGTQNHLYTYICYEN